MSLLDTDKIITTESLQSEGWISAMKSAHIMGIHLNDIFDTSKDPELEGFSYANLHYKRMAQFYNNIFYEERWIVISKCRQYLHTCEFPFHVKLMDKWVIWIPSLKTKYWVDDMNDVNAYIKSMNLRKI